MSIVKSFSFPDGEIRGDMFYIKHGTNNFTVIDCYLLDGAGKNARKDEIITEIKRESDGRICRFISTHPDLDHIAGLEKLYDEWKILNFYAVSNDYPGDNNNSFKCYKYLLNNKNYPIYHGIERRWLNDKDENNGSSGIRFLWPDVHNEKFKHILKNVAQGDDINNICPIFTYTIKNGATYMWMGDLETEMQQAYYDEYKDSIPNVDILFQPHHGRTSGKIPCDLLNALNPKIIVIGNAPAKHIEYGDSRQTLTQNTSGDIVFENEEGRVHIYTQKEINNRPACLTIEENKSNILKNLHGFQIVDWYYAGTLTI